MNLYQTILPTVVVVAILERIEAHEATPFRPFIGQRDCPPDVLDLMEKCWADNPEERPPFVTIRSTVRDIMKLVWFNKRVVVAVLFANMLFSIFLMPARAGDFVRI